MTSTSRSPDAPPAVTVPDRLALSIRALGAAGESWLTGLPGLLAGLAADWSVTVGSSMSDGRGAYVAAAVTQDGTPVVLKVLLPPGPDEPTGFQRQLSALRPAGGDPYVGLLRHDAPRQALLLERLGPPMTSLDRPAAARMEAMARTAARGWRSVPQAAPLPDGAEAARWHANFATSTWQELDRPCPEAVVDLAVRCAAAREAAFDPGRAVLVHGDVHESNILRAPEGGFRLIDPGGLRSEPAHDLGVIQTRGVQGWIDELAAGDPQQVRELMIRSCRRAGRLTGIDATAIWQWAFAELVSTGLLIRRLGNHEEAATFLTVAGKLTAAGAGPVLTTDHESRSSRHRAHLE
ncbi:aminoglycoside phosphotransferase family protein [Micromonosporaceae bacterium Da 78-11]